MNSSADATVAAIRVAELNAARRLEQARHRADDRVRAAEDEARRLVEEARRRGAACADQRHAEQLRVAQKRAAALLADAAAEAEALRRAAGPRREDVAEAMLRVVLAAPAGEEG